VRILQRLDKLEPSETVQLALWACAVGPDAAGDLAPAIALAKKRVEKDSGSLQQRSTLGALLCRAGRNQEAVQTLLQADQLTQQGDAATSPAYTWFFLAMAQHRLGNREQARVWMIKAVDSTEKALAEHNSGTSRLSWNRRLTFSLLRNEAQALLGAALTPASQPKNQVAKPE
jgi:tetratricopeptide (TPR) repeat protein